MKNRLIVIATPDLAARFPGYQAASEPVSIAADKVKSLLADPEIEVAFFSGHNLVTNSIPIRVILQAWEIAFYSNRTLSCLEDAETTLLICEFDMQTSPADWNWTEVRMPVPAAA